MTTAACGTTVLNNGTNIGLKTLQLLRHKLTPVAGSSWGAGVDSSLLEPLLHAANAIIITAIDILNKKSFFILAYFCYK
jgi:hypothetical protein